MDNLKLHILAFAAHPDDVELSAAGTVLKHIDMGYKAGIVDLTRGELGTRGTPEDRDREAVAAAEFMGLSARENLGLHDGFFTNDEESQRKVITAIRKYRPEIVLCNAVRDRHIDHGKGSELVADSCFLSGLAKIDTGQEAWRPRAVYHYIQDRYIHPAFVVDITAYMEKKIETVMCFKSQFYNPDSDEPETPISSLAFLEFLRARAREMGRQAGYEFAEGFTVERYPGVTDLLMLH
jgi:bacillithiol biosynthesis deacetylase BshB1